MAWEPIAYILYESGYIEITGYEIHIHLESKYMTPALCYRKHGQYLSTTFLYFPKLELDELHTSGTTPQKKLFFKNRQKKLEDKRTPLID